MKTCELCGNPLTDKQIKSDNLFCGRSCANKRMAQLRSRPPMVRFWEKVDKNGDCWLWTAAVDKDGYGVFTNQGKYRKSHRFIYEAMFGAIPAENIICHTCDTPSCVNPTHLYLGTYKTNANDRKRRGRDSNQSGERNHMAVLTRKSVREIRKLWADRRFTQAELASQFGVSRGCITGVIYNANWKEIK